MKTEKQIAADAAEFAERWRGKGDEKSESQLFWTDLLQNVYGVEDVTSFIRYEERVKVDNTNFIDGHIPSTRVLIEQKSIDKDLRKGIVQSNGAVLNPFQQARKYVSGMPLSQHPRWIVTCNFQEFLVYDMEQPNGEPQQILLKNLGKEYYRLMFLVNEKSAHLSKEEQVSFDAGKIVARIHDALMKQYADDSPEALRWLNILCVRIVFCLYAEDAGAFHHDQFHDFLSRYEAEDMRRALRDLFEVLNTPMEKRSRYLKDDLKAFPYTNGGLFEEEIEIPQFTEELRQVLLQNASLDFDWSEISPTIFGAVFESTLNPETRRSGGMHYTSIQNIHKVIDPLFLNDLRRELDDILEEPVERQRQKKLDAYQEKLASLTFLDPACGSGNFLTETYLSLRRLENEVIRERYHGQSFFSFDYDHLIKVSIQQFYGIEINDFAVAVATTALWISEAQMLAETEKIIGHDLDFLPLKSYTNIREGNALRMDWRLGTRTSPSAETDLGSRTSPSANTIEDYHSRGYLPHLENKEYQFITFRLFDSVPKEVIEQWKIELKLNSGSDISEDQLAEKEAELRKRIDRYEDMGYGSCYLSDERIARIVAESLMYDDGNAYDLIRWCIMPNHVHVLIKVKEVQSISSIVGRWKSYTAHEANRILNRQGAFWMEEYFDRFIRNAEHYDNTIEYIDNNPVKAGLADEPSLWPWCSGARGLGTRTSSSANMGTRTSSSAETRTRTFAEINHYVADGDVRVPNYIIGNPPFVGARMMTGEQKQDVLDIFGEKWKNVGNLDYVCCWYRKAAKLMKDLPQARAALVSTNSICQGEQVANLWQPLMEEGLQINFAHRTFRWDSESNLKAHVHCVIVGFSYSDNKERVIYDNDKTIKASHINGYLTDAPDIFIESRKRPICDVPEIRMGNQPIDGGNYIFDKEEMEEFIRKEPLSANLFHPYYGAYEFINQKPRYCLWLGDCSPAELRKMPHCMKRIETVRDARLASKRASTLKLADKPTRFQTENFPKGDYIVIPEVSSEKRRYIPMGIMSDEVICSNKLRIMPNVSLYHFGVLQSNVHMAWMRAVAGRLEMRYDYSIAIVYNNFPWPQIADEDVRAPKQRIAETAQAILDARAIYPDASLADLYDELSMPPELRKAHQDNDRAVMQAYGFPVKSTFTESQCVAELFKLYKELTK